MSFAPIISGDTIYVGITMNDHHNISDPDQPNPADEDEQLQSACTDADRSGAIARLRERFSFS